MSDFDGHVKLSILNSPNNPDLPDLTVGARVVGVVLTMGSDSVIPSIHTFELNL